MSEETKTCPRVSVSRRVLLSRTLEAHGPYGDQSHILRGGGLNGSICSGHFHQATIVLIPDEVSVNH